MTATYQFFEQWWNILTEFVHKGFDWVAFKPCNHGLLGIGVAIFALYHSGSGCMCSIRAHGAANDFIQSINFGFTKALYIFGDFRAQCKILIQNFF